MIELAGGDGDQGAAGGDGVHIIQGSALCALEDTKPELGVEAINQLTD